MGSGTLTSLTDWDLSFLKGLYAAPATLYAGAQRGAITDAMKHDLSGGKTNKR